MLNRMRGIDRKGSYADVENKKESLSVKPNKKNACKMNVCIKYLINLKMKLKNREKKQQEKIRLMYRYR